MKKGIIRIVIGIVMIILQLISLTGNATTGLGFQLSFDSAAIFFYDLIYLLTYFLVGIVGVIFLIWGIIAHQKNNQ